MRASSMAVASGFVLGLVACAASSDDGNGPAPASTTQQGPGQASPPSMPGVPAPPPPPAGPSPDDPGPPPAGCPVIQPDADGFFTRSSGLSNYVGFVSKSYNGAPTRLVVGMHGCGDDPYNFATWAIAPYDLRGTLDWIGISVGGETGSGNCWKQADEDKVFAAIADVSKCYYAHKQKYVLAGYSSGGELAYGIGMRHTAQFSGILIENSTLSSAGNPDTLLAGAAWKINIAHIAHNQDDSFPIAKVQADWAKIKAAGFPIQTSAIDGDHNGTSDDWVNWLTPKMADWRLP